MKDPHKELTAIQLHYESLMKRGSPNEWELDMYLQTSSEAMLRYQEEYMAVVTGKVKKTIFTLHAPIHNCIMCICGAYLGWASGKAKSRRELKKVAESAMAHADKVSSEILNHYRSLSR